MWVDRGIYVLYRCVVVPETEFRVLYSIIIVEYVRCPCSIIIDTSQRDRLTSYRHHERRDDTPRGWQERMRSSIAKG